MADQETGDSTAAVALRLMIYMQEIARQHSEPVQASNDAVLALYSRCYKAALGRAPS